MEAGHGEITVLLQRWRSGDRDAESHLFELLIPDLRKIAGYCLRGERRGHSMQSTMLVNEAFLRLANANQIDWQDRSHFLAVAARIMRHYLIDHARHKGSVVFIPIDGLRSHRRKAEFWRNGHRNKPAAGRVARAVSRTLRGDRTEILSGLERRRGSQDSRASPAHLSTALSARKNMAVPATPIRANQSGGDRDERVMELLEEALQRPSPERESYLRSRCAIG